MLKNLKYNGKHKWIYKGKYKWKCKRKMIPEIETVEICSAHINEKIW